MKKKKAKLNSHSILTMSRKVRNIIIFLIVVLLAAVIVADRSRNAIPIKGNNDSVSSEDSDRIKYHGKYFKIVKVVDGDTVDIDMPDGNYQTTRIRLWGIDTPETKNDRTGVMYFGPEASKFTGELCLGKNTAVLLDKISPTRDKYGRLLAYLRLEDGRIVNEVLLSEGLAYADTRFEHSYYTKYKQLESLAKADKKGLWESVKPEQQPGWRTAQ